MTSVGMPKARFARNLRVLRKALGLTQKELADRIGKSRNTVNAWEDPDVPTMPEGSDTMEQLAKALGVTVIALNYDDLIGSSGAAVKEPVHAPPSEPRYRGRDLPRLVEVIAKKFELEALETGATSEEMGVIRTTLYSSETVQMFHMGWDGAPMTEDEQRVEMEALTGKLRVWLKERIRRRTEASKKK